MSEAITYERLRALGFRIEWPLTDGRPRMILCTRRDEEQFLELCPRGDQEWHCWLRCDCSHRRARFIHIRPLRSMDEVALLVHAISGQPATREEYDAEKFAEAVERARIDGEQRWKEYCDRDHQRDFIARFT